MVAHSATTTSERAEQIRTRTVEHWQRHLADTGVLHLQVLGIREFGGHDGDHWKALIEELSNELIDQKKLIRERLAQLN